jgi:hypothetical protein
MGKKADDVCRLAFLNVEPFPATFKKWQIGVWGWAELNVN